MKAQDLNYKKTQLNEGVIDSLRYIVDNKDARRIQFDNGESMEVDMFTASAILNLYNAVNDTNKGKIEDSIGKNKQMFYKLADFAFSNLKEDSHIGRGDILVNDETETVKMTESAYYAKPASSRMTIKEQPYILINKPIIGETAYSVEFTKNQPILESEEFEPGTRVHAGVGTKGGAGFSGTVTKEENGFVFFKSDEGKTYKAPKDKVMPTSDVKFNEAKDVPSKHQEKIARDTVKNPDKALLGGPSAEEAEKMLRDKFGYSDAQIKKLKESAHINEKAVSKDQQQAAGAALAAKKGEIPVSELQGASKEMYDSMTKKELEDFAATKHSGLPEKVDEAKDYKAVKDSDGRYSIYTVGETGSKQDVVKDGLTKSQAKKMIDKLYAKDMDLIDEDSLDENAFNQAAADAALAGKKEFKFNGKTYPVEMDKETAAEISENSENVFVDMEQDEIAKAVLDPDDYGPEAGSEMAETQLHYIVYAISEIKNAMKAGYHMPDWLQNKISSAHQDMQGIHSYMEGSRRKREMCGPISEGYVGSDYGPEAASGMARTQLSFMKYAAEDVLNCISAGTPIPEWYQNKISKVHRAIEIIYSYIEGKKRYDDEESVVSVTPSTEMSTPATQPPSGTGALFVGGEEDYMAESNSSNTKSQKLRENKKSDWNVDKQVKRTMASPIFKTTEGDKDPEEVKQMLLKRRENIEEKLFKEIALPVNQALINLYDFLRNENAGTISAYMSDSEKKFLKEFVKDLRDLNDRYEKSSIMDPKEL
mgnify:FL=1